MVLDFLAVDNFDFTRKIVKKNLGKKLVKCWGFVKIEFWDKNFSNNIMDEKLSIHPILLTTLIVKIVKKNVFRIFAPKILRIANFDFDFFFWFSF